MNEKKPLAVTRGVKHIKLLSALVFLGLASQSVYAADGSSTGIPSWVWVVIALVILIGVTLLPKKWTEQSKDKKVDNKVPTPTPVAKAPPVTKPQPPKAEAPVVTPAPVVKTEPVPAPVVEAPKVEAPKVETVKEVPPAKPVEIDALDEAKQLLAQQRFPQAVGILNKGLQKDPNRSDLMLELLEIYLKQGDHEAFDAQFAQLQKLDDPFALIQAEELHRQLERPTVVEESDTIEFDASKTVVPEPETETASPVHDYAVESLDFTSAKTQSDDLTPEPTAVAPVEHDFSLDEIDLKPTISAEKESAPEVTAKSDLDEFDFSAFDLNVPEAPKAEVKTEVVETAPVELKVEAPAAKPEVQAETKLDTAPLVDLDFNFDDSFAVDEDKQDAIKSEPTSTAKPTAEPTLGEIIKGDDLSSLEEEFPFLQSVDTFQTRLDLARSYITLGEIDSARELLNEVAEQGGSAQQTEARELIAKLAS
ncbi:MAG: tetratricopeptide repeat protein [Gammaproteobacteria bacterium]|nr:tetratricopeptide repeat protein [Gammaproteobacteria bacterium]